MPKMKDLLDEAVNETLSMRNGPIERWNNETPAAPFGPSIAAGDEFGSYQTSNKAMNALAQIADNLQANDPDIDRTISQDTVRLEAATTLGELLNEFALSGDLDVNWKRYRQRLKERLDRRKLRLTHYFPVWLFLDQQAPDFDIGPVTFRTPGNWISEVERRRGERSSWMDGVLDAWAGHLNTHGTLPIGVQSVTRSVHADQWVACVTVGGFDRAESYRRALLATRSALDTMRLILPSPENAKIGTSVDHGPPVSVDRLSQLDGQDLAHGRAINLRGLRGAPVMAGNVMAHSLLLRQAAGRRISVLLQSDASVAPCRKLSERWINALHWYGRACSDEMDFAAVVNFVIALDILCGGLEEKGILELAARLLQLPVKQCVAPGIMLKQLVGRMYGYRSEIGHGSILALDERLRSERAQAEVLAATILVVYVEELEKYASGGGSDDRDDFRNSLKPVPAGS